MKMMRPTVRVDQAATAVAVAGKDCAVSDSFGPSKLYGGPDSIAPRFETTRLA